jgi:hypothetical protein
MFVQKIASVSFSGNPYALITQSPISGFKCSLNSANSALMLIRLFDNEVLNLQVYAFFSQLSALSMLCSVFKKSYIFHAIASQWRNEET